MSVWQRGKKSKGDQTSAVLLYDFFMIIKQYKQGIEIACHLLVLIDTRVRKTSTDRWRKTGRQSTRESNRLMRRIRERWRETDDTKTGYVRVASEKERGYERVNSKHQARKQNVT